MSDSYNTVPGRTRSNANSIKKQNGTIVESIGKLRTQGQLTIQDVKDQVQVVGMTRVYVRLSDGTVEDAVLTAVTPDEVADVMIHGRTMMDWWNQDKFVDPDDRVLEVQLGVGSNHLSFPESKVYLK